MGPRASARGNTNPRKGTRPTCDKLQWGRARPHAEIANRRFIDASHVTASMGPRASARGNIVFRDEALDEWALQWGRARPHAEMPKGRERGCKPFGLASMGPRASARGNRALNPARFPRIRFNGAARVRTRKYYLEVGWKVQLYKLQWGRARPHAEMHLSWPE